VLNTSLNMPGHTIVETLDDVKEMMEQTELKYCYLPEVNKLIINEDR
jgi:predicted NodU family carbamoyl transferase